MRDQSPGSGRPVKDRGHSVATSREPRHKQSNSRDGNIGTRGTNTGTSAPPLTTQPPHVFNGLSRPTHGGTTQLNATHMQRAGWPATHHGKGKPDSLRSTHPVN
mgnify:FL=1